MGVAAAAIVAAGAVAAAGVSAYSSSQQAKAQRNAAGELGGLPYGMQLSQAKAYSKQQLKNDKEYAKLMLELGPQFAAQQLDFQKQSALAALGLYPDFAAAERKETTKTRQDDATDLNEYGDEYVKAFAANSPGFKQVSDEVAKGRTYTPLLGKLNMEALLAGRSPIGAALEEDAYSDLLLGRALSPGEERAADQSARGAFAARGLGFSNAAIGTEILNRDNVASDRQDRRRNYAADVMGLLGNEDEANRRFELNTEGLNTGEEQSWRNFALGAEGVTSRPLYTELGTRAPANVMSNVLGAMGLGYDSGSTGQILSGAPQIVQGAQALTPLYNYGADVFNTNFNAAESRAIASRNTTNAAIGGVTSAAGSIGSAYLKSQNTTGGGGSGGGYY